jgi:carbon-nitrogen hydrolase
VTSLRIAIAQLPVTGDARKNGRQVRDAMHTAAAGGARLVQFPEGMLSGYAKNPIRSWAEVDWVVVRAGLSHRFDLLHEGTGARRDPLFVGERLGGIGLRAPAVGADRS